MTATVDRFPFDVHQSAFIVDPYPQLQQLREEQPFFWHEPSGMWFCSDHAGVDSLLRDRRLGREPLETPANDNSLPNFDLLNRHSLFDKEPPDHTRLRALVQRAFTPRRVRNLQPAIRQQADELAKQLRERGSFDLIADFAEPLPLIVIADLLGVPQSDRVRLRAWSRAIVAMYELDPPAAAAEKAERAASEFVAYLRHLCDRRRAEPTDDLLTALVFAELEGDKLTEDELIATVVLLLNAGHEATVNAIGLGVLALLTHPQQMALLQDDTSLVSAAVEELLRYDTPLQLFKRWVRQEMTFRDCTLRRGQQIALLFGAANRDPQQFEWPQRLDVTRAPNPHLGFGAGLHYCLGAPLARIELEVALETLLQLGALRLEAEPVFLQTFVIRGLRELQLRIVRS